MITGSNSVINRGLSRLFGKATGVLLAAAMIISGQPAAADAYRLSPGDRVLVQIIVLNNQSYVGTVDTSGDIRLPYLGTHRAVNKTLDELAQEISLSVAGRQIQSVRDGITSVIVLDEEDIFLDIETYRPVTVVGAVASPGRVVFEPGLSARAAIGSAGGTSMFGQSDNLDQQANWRTRQAELLETQAWLAADLWRIDMLLSEEPTDAPLTGDFASVADRLKESDIESVRQRIDGARGALDRERADNDARIALTEKELQFLSTAFEQFTIASEIEEERLQDVLQLSDRGLITANALDNAREGALNASSRLLTTQADLAATERELQSLKLTKEGLYEDFKQELLNEKAQVERNYDEAVARLSSLNRELALGMVEDDTDVVMDVRIILHRQNGEDEISTQVPPSELLKPGDVLEVVVSYN